MPVQKSAPYPQPNSTALNRDAIAQAAARHADSLSSVQRRAFQRAMIAVEDHNAHVIALGGSVMAGGACQDRKLGYGRSCAYASRFAAFLEDCGKKASRARGGFYYENRAIPATSTVGVLPQLSSLLSIVGSGRRLRGPDLLIIDFSMNDVASYADGNGTMTLGDYDLFRPDQSGMASLDPVPGARIRVPVKVRPQDVASFMKDLGVPGSDGRGKTPSMMSIGDARRRTRLRVNEDVIGATEVLLRHVLSKFPSQTAIVLMDGSCCVSRSYERSRAGVCGATFKEFYELSRRSRAALAAAYGLPYLSYEDMLNDECTNANYFAAYAHPNANTHIVMTEALSLWWVALAQRLATTPSPRRENAHGHSSSVKALHPPLTRRWANYDVVCQEPLTTYDPFNLVDSDELNRPGVRVIEGNWTLYADRAEKPGWISTGPINSEIEFDLQFGKIPRVTIVYDQRCVATSASPVVGNRSRRQSDTGV